MGTKCTRKIIRIGHSSLAVIIPRNWLRYYNLQHGDQVDVLTNGSIQIKPKIIGGGIFKDE